MIQMSVISGHPVFTGFRRLTCCQRDPLDWGVTEILVLMDILVFGFYGYIEDISVDIFT